jgi:hypothetical protein
MVEVAAGRHIRAKGLRNFTAGRGPASWRKLIRELYEEHRALGGRERQPSLEKATCGELQKIARQIGLTNQTLRGERKTAP